MATGDVRGWTGRGSQKYIETADGDAIQLIAPASLDASGAPVARGIVTQTQVVNVTSVPAGYSASGTSTNASAQALVGVSGGYIILDRVSDIVNVTASVTFGASITADPDVLILTAVDDGAGGLIWDHTSAPFSSYSVPRTASATIQRTVRVAANGVRALQVIVKNNDSTNALSAVKVWLREVS